jgi:ribosomal protein S18 acetylase RimI-like enzyme
MDEFRRAQNTDAEFLVPLYVESSGGTWPAIWKAFAVNGESLTQSGVRYLCNPHNALSVSNTLVVEERGERLGAMTTYRQDAIESTVAGAHDFSALPRDLLAALAPYRGLTESNSLYIAELCCLANARGRGLGSRFLACAKKSAAALGLPRVSLRVFAANTAALALYERSGFSLVDQRQVVPHVDINASGSVLLMSCVL